MIDIVIVTMIALAGGVIMLSTAAYKFIDLVARIHLDWMRIMQQESSIQVASIYRVPQAAPTKPDIAPE